MTRLFWSLLGVTLTAGQTAARVWCRALNHEPCHNGNRCRRCGVWL